MPAQSSGATYGVEIVWHMRDRGDMGDHMGGVAAVAGDAGDLMHVLAGESLSRRQRLQ